MTGTAPSNPARSTAGSAAPVAGSQVPDGTREDVLAWAGNDPARVQAAYDAEMLRAQPRSTLVAELQTRGATG